MNRNLHWVFKVRNLGESLEFYQDILGMHVIRHEEFGSGCEATCNGPYSRPWSKTMVGYGPEIDHFVLELTYNYGITSYTKGNDFRYINIRNDQVIKNAATHSWPIEALEDGTFVTCPDGNRFRLCGIEAGSRPGSSDPILSVSINVSNLEKAQDYYCNVLGMSLFLENETETERSITLGWSPDQAKLELVEPFSRKDQPIDHGQAFGRLAIATSEVGPVFELIKHSGDTIQNEPVKLETPGKATVEVIILRDRDDYELCFVDEEGFNSLCQPFEGCDKIHWEVRKQNGANDEF